MTYAIIKNGVCENIIEAEADFAEEIGAVLLPEGFGMGDLCAKGKWTKKPESADTVSASEKRRAAYENMREREDGSAMIESGGEALTVDEAVSLWTRYAAEGNEEKAAAVQAPIAAAKEYIRGLFPDEA